MRTSTNSANVTVPAEVLEIATESLGKFFEPVSKIDRRTSAADYLDMSKSFKRAAIISRDTELKGKRMLEIGSGFGTNLAVWIKHFQSMVTAWNRAVWVSTPAALHRGNC
jgi:ubiquinone/menaquinone biosynthesis C-methylase UbiE